MRLIVNVYISWLSILKNPLKHWISLFLYQLCHPSKCKKNMYIQYEIYIFLSDTGHEKANSFWAIELDAMNSLLLLPMLSLL